MQEISKRPATRIELSPSRAKRLCQYRTPEYIAEVMARWAVTAQDNLVLDPCCGDSNLLEKAVERLLKLGSTPSSASEKVYGIEINQKTTLFAIANLERKLGVVPNHLRTEDFLKVEVDELPRFNALLCNPPYRRHHDLSKTYKDFVFKKILKDTGIMIPKTASLYVHFFIHASQFLADKGRMIFLTPSQFLTNSFGKVLRDTITKKFQLRCLLLFDENLSVFPNAMSTACLTLLEKKQPETDAKVMFIKTERILTAEELWNALCGKPSAGVSVHRIPQEKLRQKERWNTLFQTDNRPAYTTRKLQDFAKTKRGLATGANNFFVLTHEDVRKLGIESCFLVPLLAKAHYAPYLDFLTEDWFRLREGRKKVWLFACSLPKEQLAGTNALCYIEQGERLGYNHRYLASHRQPWYRLENRPPSKIFLTYMSNGNPRFIYNEANVVALNVFHCVYPDKDKGMNVERTKALLSYLSSSPFRSALPYLGRIYSGGLLKIEPGEAQRLPVVNIDEFSKSALADLARLFDRLRKEYRKNRIWDTTEIDQAIESL